MDDNSLDFTHRPNGTRGYGAPGKYKGILDLDQVLYHYLVATGFQPVTAKYSYLTNITFIYENCNDDNTSLKNTFRELKIVREGSDIDTSIVQNTTDLTTGVYKPDNYVLPQFPTTPVFEHDPEAEAAAKAEADLEEIEENTEEETEQGNGILIWIIAAAIVIIASGTVVILIAVKKKKAKVADNAGKDGN